MKKQESGFTLVEMLVAMVVAALISGAIYAMVSAGETSFRVQPAVADRQQNARVAMDLITKDVLAAEWFIDGKDGGSGPDEIWIFRRNDSDCPNTPISGTSGVNVDTAVPMPACYPEPGMYLIFYPDGTVKLGWGHNIHAKNGKLNFPNGQQPDGIDPTPLDTPSIPSELGFGYFVKYAIAPDPEDNVPSLWRTDTGGYGTDGTEDNGNGGAPASPHWQLVARGIEDLQVRYLRHDGFAATNWLVNPGAYTYPNGVIRRVEVTVQSRTVGVGRAPGVTTWGGATEMRGQLVTEISPRGSIMKLISASPRPSPSPIYY